MSIRNYLWGDQPRRLPRDFDRRRYPELAGTRQKLVNVWFDRDEEGHLDCWSVRGERMPLIGYERFDEDGYLDPRHVMREVGRNKDAWLISEADCERIRADLAGERRIPIYKRIASG